MKKIENLLKIAGMKFGKTWKLVFTNVRFRSWSSKLLSVNAALVTPLVLHCLLKTF